MSCTPGPSVAEYFPDRIAYICDRFRLMEAVSAKVREVARGNIARRVDVAASSALHCICFARPEVDNVHVPLLCVAVLLAAPSLDACLHCHAGPEGLFRPQCGGGDPCDVETEYFRLCDRTKAFFLGI